MSKQIINLISDTITKPTPEMLQAMLAAEVGDDVFQQDPTINKLEKMVSDLFAKEAAMFCPSGTMTNQIAIKTHTNPLDEVICDITSHIYQYESAGYSFNSGVSMNLIHGDNGKINAQQVVSCIKADFDWLPNSKLVVIENSCNKGGGNYYTLPEIKEIKKVCKEHDLSLHLDGARLFNVLVETNETTQDVGALFDSISICISKGLGAPVGSLLIGTNKFIKQARRFRKVMGGGMRQAGYLAAACIYALENNIERLKKDNDRAKRIGAELGKLTFIDHIKPVKTNILIFDLKPNVSTTSFLEYLQSHQIQAIAFGPQSIRFVMHLEVSDDMEERLIKVLRKYEG